jgi:hypothetical protein
MCVKDQLQRLSYIFLTSYFEAGVSAVVLYFETTNAAKVGN